MFGIFDIEGDLVFAAGRDIMLLAEADVVVPTWVPFIGGDKLGGFGFFFEHVCAHDNVPTSTTFAAWIDIDLFRTITVGFEVVIDANGNANWSLIGGDQVAGFQQALSTRSTDVHLQHRPVRTWVPAGTTSLMAKVDWSRPAPGSRSTARPSCGSSTP